MLFPLTLPPKITDRLTKASLIQLQLFKWAAYTEEASLEACRDWLQNHGELQDRAEAICSWIDNSEKRRNRLLDFARCAERAEKTQWAERIIEEHDRLLHAAQGELEALPEAKRNKPLPAWQTNGKNLLILFYDELRSEAGLPKTLFADNTKFTAQDYLLEFQTANSKVIICPFCQEMAYCTITRDRIYTDIDHYFPKDLYPHLSIHPYNLIPICHACNSGMKLSKDPLKYDDQPRRTLEHIWTPYRSRGLNDRIALEVQADEKHRPQFVQFIPLQEDESVVVALDILNNIYRTLERWQQRNDVIGEKVFRRIRDFIRFFHLNDPEHVHDHIGPYLQELIYWLEQEDMPREPYTIPMMWWLVYLIAEELSDSETPFAQELRDCFGDVAQHARRRQERGAELRQWHQDRKAQHAATSE
ncbi:MAG TPA: hypothetical protein VGD69_10805 [Herpetosiphonaceae bacterium]